MINLIPGKNTLNILIIDDDEEDSVLNAGTTFIIIFKKNQGQLN